MQNWRIEMKVDNKKTEITVKASGSADAKKLAQAMYPTSKIVFFHVRQV
jgi:hypothetical protein